MVRIGKKKVLEKVRLEGEISNVVIYLAKNRKYLGKNQNQKLNNIFFCTSINSQSLNSLHVYLIQLPGSYKKPF